jgi:hypothetical protein
MIKNHELTVPRKEALATGLLLDISHPARVYGQCPIPAVLTRSLWRALAKGAQFDDRDEQVVRLCFQMALVLRGQGPSSTITIPGLQLSLLSYTGHAGQWDIRAMRHLTEEGEPVCTLCGAGERDLERCADVLFRCRGRDLTVRMYRVLGLPPPKIDLARLGGSELWRLPIERAPEESHSPIGQPAWLVDGKMIGEEASDLSAIDGLPDSQPDLPA